jgi:hypothetical protein
MSAEAHNKGRDVSAGELPSTKQKPLQTTGKRIAGAIPAPLEAKHRVDNMAKNPVLDLLLSDVMRSEIALPLQHVLHLYTVGQFLRAWRNPRNHSSIEQVFDSPEQAHHALAVCAAWVGVRVAVANDPNVGWWWPEDQNSSVQA